MRAEKQQMVAAVSAMLKDRPAILISYQGLTANVFNEFRGKLTAIGAECHVVPNTLVKNSGKAIDITFQVIPPAAASPSAVMTFHALQRR